METLEVKIPDRMVLKGDQIMCVIRTNPKPAWIPRFLWAWMVRTVVKSQTVSGSITVIRSEDR